MPMAHSNIGGAGLFLTLVNVGKLELHTTNSMSPHERNVDSWNYQLLQTQRLNHKWGQQGITCGIIDSKYTLHLEGVVVYLSSQEKQHCCHISLKCFYYSSCLIHTVWKNKNLKSNLIFFILHACLFGERFLSCVCFPLCFGRWGERLVFMQWCEKLSEIWPSFSIFFSLYRMIISETGIPTSPLTKVKDALFLVVYSMGNAVSFFLFYMLSYCS